MLTAVDLIAVLNLDFLFYGQAASMVPGSKIPPGGYVAAMNTWVLQMGYPVVELERDPNNQNSMKVRQSRFLSDPEADIEKPESPYKCADFSMKYPIYL